MKLRAAIRGEEKTVLSGLVGWENSDPRSMRSKMDDVWNADCGELANELAGGVCRDQRRDCGGIETDVWDKMVFIDDPEDWERWMERRGEFPIAECKATGLPRRGRFFFTRSVKRSFLLFRGCWWVIMVMDMELL